MGLLMTIVALPLAACGDDQDAAPPASPRLAQLSAVIDDPMTLAEDLDNKERQALRKVDMPAASTQDPWLRIVDTHRADAADAWQTITGSASGALAADIDRFRSRTKSC